MESEKDKEKTETVNNVLEDESILNCGTLIMPLHKCEDQGLIFGNIGGMDGGDFMGNYKTKPNVFLGKTPEKKGDFQKIFLKNVLTIR